MSNNRVRVFEGTHVPLIFERALVPKGSDPDGLGPLTDVDRRYRIEYEMVCKRDLGWRPQLKRLAKEVFEYQKYQLKNSHSVADENGELADNMNIEDINPWLAKLGVLEPINPDYIFDECVHYCRYTIVPWVFPACEKEGVFLELIAAVCDWDAGGALESTPYPGDRAIDGDGHYPILVVQEEVLHLDFPPVELHPDIAIFAGEPPKRTQSKAFTDYQWPKGHCPNKGGRPRRCREVEDIDDRRPHFFETLMPAVGDGERTTYGDAIYRLSRSRAVDEGDFSWVAKTDCWALELDRIRSRRKKFRNGGFAYKDTLAVTRLDIAIRHLDLVDIQWCKSPSARWVINPWIVSDALERMKEGDLTRDEMEGIYVRVKTPHKVDWPKWWPEELRCKHSKNEQLMRPRRKISGTLTKA